MSHRFLARWMVPFPSGKWNWRWPTAPQLQVSASNRKQPSDATASGFLLPYVHIYVCVHDSLLLLAASLYGGGQGLQEDKFPRVGNDGAGMKSKGKGTP